MSPLDSPTVRQKLLPATYKRLHGEKLSVDSAAEMLVVRPDLVRLARAEPGRLGELNSDLVDRIFREGFRSVTANGVLGDTRGASEEIGLATFSRAAEIIAGHFARNFASTSEGEPTKPLSK